MNIIQYFIEHASQILKLLLEHIELTAIAVALAILIGVPIGILISYVKKLNKPILAISSVIQAIPSMALLGFAIPLLGIGSLPSVVIVILYSLLPIIKNTFTGISNINEQTIESAKGIGLTKWQILFKVQIPLALPVIMAGIRISAVTAVGLMTMAAFIGAGGLGYLVFSGIRTVNNYQILAGAVPACILALIVDFLAGLVEKLVTPISLQKQENTNREHVEKTRRHQKTILLVSLIIVIGLFAYSFFTQKKTSENSITVGGKDFTEQLIVNNMVADMIEDKTDLQVNRHMNLGGTQVCFGALKSGEIDMYVEYLGTAYGDTLKLDPISDLDKAYDTVKTEFKSKYHIDVLDQMAFNNTYTLAVKPEIAEKYQLKTISDLAKVAPQLKLGATLEFLNRKDGLDGLSKAYDLNFQETSGIDGSSRYLALEKGDVDVVDAFLTDGLLTKYQLVVLEDDKNFFPRYDAIPILKESVYKKNPEIKPLMDQLGNLLTADVMSELNYKVDVEQITPEEVAHTFLQEQGILSK